VKQKIGYVMHTQIWEGKGNEYRCCCCQESGKALCWTTGKAML